MILENNINDTIFNYANEYNHYFYRGQGLVLHEANWTTEVESRLRKFEKRIIFALKNEGWDGKESNDTVTWTFAGGLFYSITVITTIGTIKQNTKTAKLPFEMIFFFQVMVILLQRLLGQKSLQYFTQFWAYLLQYCVGLILEMLWQMPSDFAIGEFVVTFVQRNPKRRKNVI